MSDTKIIAPGSSAPNAASKAARPTWKPAGKVHAGEQPFHYPLKREFVEPDWRRLPGYKNIDPGRVGDGAVAAAAHGKESC